jgi:oligoribonuclease
LHIQLLIANLGYSYRVVSVLGVFLDTEANGLNAQINKIIELAFKIVDLSSGELKAEYKAVVAQTKEVWAKSDPNSLKVNGFSFEEVAKGKQPDQIGKETIALFGKWSIERTKAVFICQNPSFDRVFFSQLVDSDTQEFQKWPYHWLDLASMFWATSMHKNKLPWEVGFSKDLIAQQYNLDPEASPHRAMNGVDHLLLCYEAVVGFPKKKR